MQSKLAQVMFTIDLARELTGVTVNALHPSTYMNTTMVRESGNAPISTVQDGAAAIIRLATGADVEGRSGLYFDRQREARANPQAYDTTARERLRALSFELTGLPIVAVASPT
jgi:NAD(P)-dependent dehydrogenase (short-subunit alcohol dehydrogenase family)